MAEVFRPSYTVTDFATGKKTKRKSKTYHVRYYAPDGRRLRVKGYRDRKATEALATKLERKSARLAEGIAEPSDEHAKRPLADHAEDFRRYLAAKGNTADYVALVSFRLTAVLDGCRFVRIADVQASALVEFLAGLRRDGKSVKTANEYLAAAKGFTRWLWRDKRTGVDLLAGLSKLANGDSDVRHARRDFSPDELARLLDAARQSPKAIRLLTGIDRHFLYLTACATGFRVSELASMTPESFNLDGDTPTAKVQAACTKNRKEAVQPLPLDAAKALRGYLAGKPAGQLVWPGATWPTHASIVIRRDLDAARQAWLCEAQDAAERERREQSDFLAYRDAEGRYGDFHALRHSFITMVGKAGVSPKEHQDLARHSTYALTGRYTHARFYDLAAAVQSLPIPTSTVDRETAMLVATGTDGKNLGPNLSPRQAKTADSGGQRRTEQRSGGETTNPGKQAVCAVFQGSGQDPSQKRDTGVEPVWLAWEASAQPIGQSRGCKEF